MKNYALPSDVTHPGVIPTAYRTEVNIRLVPEDLARAHTWTATETDRAAANRNHGFRCLQLDAIFALLSSALKDVVPEEAIHRRHVSARSGVSLDFDETERNISNGLAFLQFIVRRGYRKDRYVRRVAINNEGWVDAGKLRKALFEIETEFRLALQNLAVSERAQAQRVNEASSRFERLAAGLSPELVAAASKRADGGLYFGHGLSLDKHAGAFRLCSTAMDIKPELVAEFVSLLNRNNA